MSEDEMFRHYMAALDEVFRLRTALQYEARVVEAHYESLKSFPKSRRPIAEQQVERMRQAASGRSEGAYAGEGGAAGLYSYGREAMPMGLTRARWENRGD